MGEVILVARRQAMARRERTPASAVVGYALSAPALMLMVVLLFGPALAILILAFTDWQLGANSAQFIGIQNFRALASDPVFWTALGNTFVYVGVVVPTVVALALVVALLIEAGERFKTFYRTVHFLPVMSTLAATAVAWEMVLHPSIGLVNLVLDRVGIEGPNWLGDERTALLSLAVIGIWENLGFALVLFLAGLKTIPTDLYDAAALDGIRTPLDRLRFVTFPLLAPVLMFVTVIVTTRAFQLFDTVAILTKGGPNKSSEVLLHALYVESFQFFRTGYGAALTLVFLGIIVVLTLAKARFLESRVHYS